VTHCLEEVCRAIESLLGSYIDLSTALSPGSADARPQPTSFLDLPDDLLLPIFEEFYEQRYESITTTTPLRIAEILVNKRIYFLARPLWYKRLSINEQQLDQRFSGLLEDMSRQAALRELEVPLTDSHAYLTKSLMSLLPRLTRISISFAEDTSDATNIIVADRLAQIATLRHLQLSSRRDNAQLWHFRSHYRARTRESSPFVAVKIGNVDISTLGSNNNGQCSRTFTYDDDGPVTFDAGHWCETYSLGLQGCKGLAITSTELIGGLGEALRSDKVSKQRYRFMHGTNGSADSRRFPLSRSLWTSKFAPSTQLSTDSSRPLRFENSLLYSSRPIFAAWNCDSWQHSPRSPTAISYRLSEFCGCQAPSICDPWYASL